MKISQFLLPLLVKADGSGDEGKLLHLVCWDSTNTGCYKNRTAAQSPNTSN